MLLVTNLQKNNQTFGSSKLITIQTSNEGFDIKYSIFNLVIIIIMENNHAFIRTHYNPNKQ